MVMLGMYSVCTSMSEYIQGVRFPDAGSRHGDRDLHRLPGRRAAAGGRRAGWALLHLACQAARLSLRLAAPAPAGQFSISLSEPGES